MRTVTVVEFFLESLNSALDNNCVCVCEPDISMGIHFHSSISKEQQIEAVNECDYETSNSLSPDEDRESIIKFGYFDTSNFYISTNIEHEVEPQIYKRLAAGTPKVQELC